MVTTEQRIQKNVSSAKKIWADFGKKDRTYYVGFYPQNSPTQPCKILDKVSEWPRNNEKIFVRILISYDGMNSIENKYFDEKILAKYLRLYRIRALRFGCTELEFVTTESEIDYGYYDDHSTTPPKFEIYGYRLETDQEFADRRAVVDAAIIKETEAKKKASAAKRAAAAAKKTKEYETFLALKAKFEPEKKS